MTTDETKKRKGYPCGAQKSRLIELVKADAELLQGKFSANFTKKEAEKRWLNISEELNCIPGAHKSWQEWRKTWQDLKHKVKKKETEIRRGLTKTGGGPPPNPLTPEEEIVLTTIQESTLVGHTDCLESLVNFRDFPSTSASPSISEVIEVDAIDTDSPRSLIAPASSDVNAVDVDFPSSSSIDALNSDHCYYKSKTKENRKTNIVKKKRITAQNRLQKTIDTGEALRQVLAEKNFYKKQFYDQYIQEMKNQTNALMMIANNLKGLHK